MRTVFALVVLVALSGCAGTPLSACRGNQTAAQTAELLFGRKIGERGLVSEAEWSGFLAREVTPRFPDGLTVFDTAGQWRDPVRGSIVREPSKVVLVVLRGDAEEPARLDAIAQAYKTRFKQQSVGVIVRSACVSF